MTSPTGPVARARFINGLRDLANFLAAHPGFPVPERASILVFPDGDSDAERRSAVDELAISLGAFPDDDGHGHHTAERYFGPVGYRLTAIDGYTRPADLDHRRALAANDERASHIGDAA